MQVCLLSSAFLGNLTMTVESEKRGGRSLRMSAQGRGGSRLNDLWL